MDSGAERAEDGWAGPEPTQRVQAVKAAQRLGRMRVLGFIRVSSISSSASLPLRAWIDPEELRSPHPRTIARKYGGSVRRRVTGM